MPPEPACATDAPSTKRVRRDEEAYMTCFTRNTNVSQEHFASVLAPVPVGWSELVWKCGAVSQFQ